MSKLKIRSEIVNIIVVITFKIMNFCSSAWKNCKLSFIPPIGKASDDIEVILECTYFIYDYSDVSPYIRLRNNHKWAYSFQNHLNFINQSFVICVNTEV